jgi:hypothetical protein
MFAHMYQLENCSTNAYKILYFGYLLESCPYVPIWLNLEVSNIQFTQRPTRISMHISRMMKYLLARNMFQIKGRGKKRQTL